MIPDRLRRLKSRFTAGAERIGALVTGLSYQPWAWFVGGLLAVAGSVTYLLTLTTLAWWLCPIAALPLFVLMLARLVETDEDLPPGDAGGTVFGPP